MGPGLELDDSLAPPETLRGCLRPVAIWLGLVAFFVGAIALGAALADGTGSVLGPLLLLLGVSLVGGGFTMDHTDFLLDPEVEFTGTERYFAAGVSLLFLFLAGVTLLAALL